MQDGTECTQDGSATYAFSCETVSKYLEIYNPEGSGKKIASIILLGGEYTDDDDSCHLFQDETVIHDVFIDNPFSETDEVEIDY